MKPVFPFLLLLLLLNACQPETINQPDDNTVHLVQAITRDSSGNHITRSARYNEFELMVSDTIYTLTGSVNGYTINQYNSKGKLTRTELTAPAAYAGGYLWADSKTYTDDTLLTSSRHYLRGSQTSFTRYFYAGNLLMTDSVLHTSFTQGNSAKKRTYDAQGRILTDLTTNTNSDSSSYLIYNYSANQMELISKGYSYLPQVYITTSRTVTTYDAAGLVITETSYDALNNISQQITNTYTSTGELLTKITVNGSGTYENRYTINATTDRPDKMDGYYNGVRTGTVTYYYE